MAKTLFGGSKGRSDGISPPQGGGRSAATFLQKRTPVSPGGPTRPTITPPPNPNAGGGLPKKPSVPVRPKGPQLPSRPPTPNLPPQGGGGGPGAPGPQILPPAPPPNTGGPGQPAVPPPARPFTPPGAGPQVGTQPLPPQPQPQQPQHPGILPGGGTFISESLVPGGPSNQQPIPAPQIQAPQGKIPTNNPLDPRNQAPVTPNPNAGQPGFDLVGERNVFTEGGPNQGQGIGGPGFGTIGSPVGEFQTQTQVPPQLQPPAPPVAPPQVDQFGQPAPQLPAQGGTGVNPAIGGLPTTGAPQGGGPPPSGDFLGNNPNVPQGTEAIGLGNLGGLLERNLANPTAFGSQQVQDAFKFLSQNLDDSANLANQNAITDAQSRGVFFGSPLTNSQGDIAERLQRGKSDLASNLLLNQAQTFGQDQQGAINNAFRFGENQLGADQFAGQLGLQAFGAGNQGAPNINSAANAIAAQPLPQVPQGSDAALGALGALFGSSPQGGGQPQGSQKGGLDISKLGSSLFGGNNNGLVPGLKAPNVVGGRSGLPQPRSL